MNIVSSGLGVDSEGFPNQGRVEQLYVFSMQNVLLDFGNLDLSPVPLVAALCAGRTADVISILAAGDDLIEGGNYDVELNFVSQGDVIIGGAGDDVFSTRDATTNPFAIASRATIDGGAGLNTITYAEAPTEVVVDLSEATAGADALANIQRVVGSRFADLISGSAGADTLRGGGDTITGGQGADWIGSGRTAADPREAVLFGGDGADTIEGDAGFNRVNGNAGDDNIVGRSLVGDWLLGGQGDDAIRARASAAGNIVNGQSRAGHAGRLGQRRHAARRARRRLHHPGVRGPIGSSAISVPTPCSAGLGPTFSSRGRERG